MTVDSIAVRKMLAKLSQSEGSWALHANNAWFEPRVDEVGIRALIQGLITYGSVHEKVHSQKIGADGFLGPAFKQIAESILTLLNGSLGRFDGGTLDRLVRDICADNGVALDS